MNDFETKENKIIPRMKRCARETLANGSWENRRVNVDTTEESHFNTSAAATLESVYT